MNQNTSTERVDALFALDEAVTPALYETVHGEFRHRRMVRHGINVIATGMNERSEETVGNELHAYLHRQLGRAGIHTAWQRHHAVVEQLPPSPHTIPGSLDELGNAYADVTRATLNMLGEPERNSAHVVHLAALALPYAAEFYPELRQSKIALYCWVHDILESYTGDVSSLGLNQAGFAKKEKAEHQALQHFIYQHQKQYPEFTQLVSNYEALSDPESAFVKSFDKLDPGFSHFANQGVQLTNYHALTTVDEFKKMVARNDAKMQSYAQPFPLLLEDRQELRERLIAVTYPTR